MKEALKLALEALELVTWTNNPPVNAAITALRQALANEALDKMAENARELGLDYEPATEDSSVVQSAQRTWVGLSDEEIMEIAFNFDVPSLVVRTVEAKLKEKNT